jgi:hypothetical protein
MRSATLSDIKKEINQLPAKELAELFLLMAKFKKENKEYLSYLLFDSHNKRALLEEIKAEIKGMVLDFNGNYFRYDFKKKLRKLKAFLSKYNKFLNDKALSIEMHLYLCQTLKEYDYPYIKYGIPDAFFGQQIKRINTLMNGLHEDLRYDYGRQLEALQDDTN